MDIWIVMAIEGEYDETDFRAVCAYATESEAKDHAREASAWYRAQRAVAERLHPMSYLKRDAILDELRGSPFDAGLKGITKYEVHRCEMMSHAAV